MQSRFRPVDQQEREREVRRALERRGIGGRIDRLGSSTVQSTYRVDWAPTPLLLRWRDHCDPLGGTNAEKEVLGALRAAGIDRVPEWKFRESTPKGAVSALSFVDGQRLKGIPPPGLAAQVGHLIASMHEAARSADLDLDIGTAWDTRRFRQLWEATRNEIAFSDEVIKFADSALSKYHSIETKSRYKTDLWGIIHSDLNASNVVVDSEPGFIDFAEAGPGLFAWDVLMLPFDLWWDYGLDAEAAGNSLIDTYVSAGGTRPSAEILRMCAEVRIVEALTWQRPSLGVAQSRCRKWIEQVHGVISRLNTAPPAWMTKVP